MLSFNPTTTALQPNYMAYATQFFYALVFDMVRTTVNNLCTVTQRMIKRTLLTRQQNV